MSPASETTHIRGRTVNGDTVVATKLYSVGPTVDARLPAGLGIEFDALYRRMNYDDSGFAPSVPFTASLRANVWEFPVLLKYRLPRFLIRGIYVAAGPSFRHVGELHGRKASYLSSYGGRDTVSDLNFPAGKAFNMGIKAAVGISRKIGPLAGSAEIRYTHWTPKFYQAYQNQVEFLLSFTFPLVSHSGHRSHGEKP